MVAEVHIADHAGRFVDDLFNDLQADVIANVIDAITPYVVWMIALHIVSLLFMGMFGKSQVLKDGLWTLFMIFVVSMISRNVGLMEEWLLVPIDNFLSLVSGAVSGSDTDTVYGVADAVINKSIAVGDQAWQKAGEAGWRDWEIKVSWWFAGIIAGVGGMVMIAPSVIAIIAMKAIISLLFMVSPIFVVAIMFPLTAKYFINWSAAVGNSIMVIVFSALIMSVASQMTSGMMEKMDVSTGLVGPWTIIIVVTFMTILFWVLIKFIFNMASTLAGGLSMSMPVTSSRVGRGATNAAYSAMTAPGRYLNSMVRMPFNRRGGNIRG